jgi:hypothetical protein
MVKSVRWMWPAIVTAMACSGSTSTSGNVTPEQACADLAGALCDKIASCSSFGFQLVYPDAATCKSRAALTCPMGLMANGATAKPSDLEACKQGYVNAACDDLVAGNQPAACQLTGSLMAGAACAENLQCAGANSYCNIPANQTCGVCATRAAAGAACGQTSDCQSGLVCGKGTGQAMGTCVTPGAEGGSCDSPHPCKSPLVCVTQTCSKPVGPGGACDSGAQNCDILQGLYCSQAKVCTMALTAGAGGACGVTGTTAAPTATLCMAGSTCKLPSNGFMGTCQAPAADGAMCDATNGPSCISPAVCTNGACKIPDPTACR